MTRKVLLVVHQETSDPGRIGAVLAALGCELDVRCAACGEGLPPTMEEHAGAVVFGGPMSANDDHLPFVRTELEWIPTVLESGRPFLGVCLGAQLLARVLGARIGPRPDGAHEIGFYPVSPTEAGRPLLKRRRHVYQWHGEGFELPAGAELLATGELFPNQAFRVGAALGVQFHPEVTGAMMGRWTRKALHRLILPGAQSREEQFRKRALYEPEIDAWLPGFLSAWLAGPAAAVGREAAE